MAPYACIAQWSRPLLWLRISPNVLAINVYDAGSASIWALFGFQQLPVLTTTKQHPNNSLERQPGNHTPHRCGCVVNKIVAWCKIPGPNGNMLDKNTTNETMQPGTRPMSDHEPHTCCSGCVVLCKVIT
ncbi:hypothetical protein BS47DRAFT_1362447 [Hydnum rufescens UP504]|uniref:Uncharacterized protein n=1 Tax=Hydnum rufescens UP504 TaxID=1448309 RepID=A0A9P6AWS7_9AGAM|nr:hypothetical protein BS47DRAFT_1362447 [Hydnum rufescens UP504]